MVLPCGYIYNDLLYIQECTTNNDCPPTHVTIAERYNNFSHIKNVLIKQRYSTYNHSISGTKINTNVRNACCHSQVSQHSMQCYSTVASSTESVVSWSVSPPTTISWLLGRTAAIQ